jgi:hypothetical protein
LTSTMQVAEPKRERRREKGTEEGKGKRHTDVPSLQNISIDHRHCVLPLPTHIRPSWTFLTCHLLLLVLLLTAF